METIYLPSKIVEEHHLTIYDKVTLLYVFKYNDDMKPCGFDFHPDYDDTIKILEEAADFNDLAINGNKDNLVDFVLLLISDTKATYEDVLNSILENDTIRRNLLLEFEDKAKEQFLEAFEYWFMDDEEALADFYEEEII